MVSAFQSRGFGFGYELTSVDLNVVNQYFQTKRLHYTEAESVSKLSGKTEKADLNESPFIKYFEYGYGAGKEG